MKLKSLVTGFLLALVACGSATARSPISQCHIDGVVVENATHSGHIYITVKAPSGCGFGVRPTLQLWQITVRDQKGLRSFSRHGGSAMGNIKAYGAQAIVTARFSVGYAGSLATSSTKATVYLNQG